MATNGTPSPGRRAAVVAGLRTPFVKAGSDFRDLSAVDLGALVVNELVARSRISPKEVDSVVFGQVIPSSTVTLIGREMVLRTQLPRSVQAHTVARACARSIRERVKIVSRLRPRDLAPVPPALKEPTTGLTMGESAERMAQKNGISREAQDELAFSSH